jgi:hypothetical protein
MVVDLALLMNLDSTAFACGELSRAANIIKASTTSHLFQASCICHWCGKQTRALHTITCE